MNRLRAMARAAAVLAGAAGLWLLVHGTALAEAATPAEAPGGRNKYLASYAVVILGIMLGLLFVCNPARRRDRAKPEAYGE